MNQTPGSLTHPHNFHLFSASDKCCLSVFYLFCNINNIMQLVIKEGCEASPNPPDSWGGTRPSPPAHQNERSFLHRQWRRSEEKQGGRREAQIHQSVGVGPSTCRTEWRGSHRLEQVQTGSDHQGFCRTPNCCCMLLLHLPFCFK